ncbi:CHAD domain-containing protein [Ruixingdingia sedimenti]|uniref:CHAD domain-containing protein n=1 Tax=Ruixingdingia sedimenti TaxID=3073604 RepID=A0ABU1FEH0_9RHOB|nr:CHAD domain-containing protein [Xinfangfangia sp. LG-4]MDR5655259.1 CHAD domain-containing protein [Xinfangfangia sp. LG-4]
MPYHFTLSDKSPAAGVRRIAAEQIDNALADLREATLPQGLLVHSLRKRVKKLRGLLRLVEPQFRDFSRQNTALRDTARGISALRDAEVRRAAFARLVPLAPTAAPEATAAISAALAAGAQHSPDAGDAALAAFREALLDLRAGVGDWRIRGDGFDTLAPGLALTWRRARRAMKAARAEYGGDFDAAPFHDWRKRAKAHWYQARLLTPIWPEMMAPHLAAADALGELLGDHNDMDVLLHHILPLAADWPETQAALAAAGMETRRDLARRALVLGRRLFAGPEDLLTDRWSVWWEVWRQDRD